MYNQKLQEKEEKLQKSLIFGVELSEDEEFDDQNIVDKNMI